MVLLLLADCDLEANNGAAFKFELDRLNSFRPRPRRVPIPELEALEDLLVSLESCEAASCFLLRRGAVANLGYSTSLDSSRAALLECGELK